MEAQVIAAVVNTINLYAIGVDTRQWQLFDEVFTADAVTDFGGPAVFSGLSAIKQLFETIHAPFDATQHATRGHHVRASGDIATCLCYYHARFLRDLPEGGNMFESAGWYDDKLVRTPQGWRIQHRTCRALWSGGNPAVLQTTPDVHVDLYSTRCTSKRAKAGWDILPQSRDKASLRWPVAIPFNAGLCEIWLR
jgi:hypothetical protein